jgi:hypothetical protein
MLHIKSSLLEWSGYDYYVNALTSNFSAASGTHIICADFGGTVDLEVSSADSFDMANKSRNNMTVIVTLTYSYTAADCPAGQGWCQAAWRWANDGRPNPHPRTASRRAPPAPASAGAGYLHRSRVILCCFSVLIRGFNCNFGLLQDPSAHAFTSKRYRANFA